MSRIQQSFFSTSSALLLPRWVNQVTVSHLSSLDKAKKKSTEPQKAEHTRFLRKVNRKIKFHQGMAAYYQSLEDFARNRILIHKNQMKCQEHVLQEMAWKFEKESQHEELVKEEWYRLMR
jgi:phage terminase small subunit